MTLVRFGEINHALARGTVVVMGGCCDGRKIYLPSVNFASATMLQPTDRARWDVRVAGVMLSGEIVHVSVRGFVQHGWRAKRGVLGFI